MKIAIVHDYLIQYGGAETVVEALHEAFPDAPIYTSLYDSGSFPDSFKGMEIRTSFLQRLPLDAKKAQRWLLALYPVAFERLDLKDFDVVISSSSSFAKGVRIGRRTCHICYCHAPPRFLWQYEQYMEKEELSDLFKIGLSPLVAWLRSWDRRASAQVHHFVANSRAVAGRIQRFYGREAAIIHPPVGVDRSESSQGKGDCFLIVSRLVPYKRIDMAIEAFNGLGLPLVVVGEGRDRRRLEGLSRPNVHFVGRVSAQELRDYYRNCRALIFPGEEDFGISCVEAQGWGRPVIAYGAGGALETVIEGLTGIFFREATAEALAFAVKELTERRFDAETIRQHALTFDRTVFKERMGRFVQAKYVEHIRGSEGIASGLGEARSPQAITGGLRP